MLIYYCYVTCGEIKCDGRVCLVLNLKSAGIAEIWSVRTAMDPYRWVRCRRQTRWPVYRMNLLPLRRPRMSFPNH